MRLAAQVGGLDLGRRLADVLAFCSEADRMRPRRVTRIDNCLWLPASRLMGRGVSRISRTSSLLIPQWTHRGARTGTRTRRRGPSSRDGNAGVD